MAKKYPPGYIKNPAKVAAGKARAASGLKNKSTGKYLPKVFTYEINKALLANKGVDVSKIDTGSYKKIDQLLKDAKLTKKQVADFYNFMPDAFNTLAERGTIKETAKNPNQLEKIFTNYKGKIFIDDGTEKKQVSSSEAKFLLSKFMQYMKTNANVVDITIMPNVNIKGEMVVQIPNTKELIKKAKKNAGVNNMAELQEIAPTELTEILQNSLNEMYEECDIVIYCS